MEVSCLTAETVQSAALALESVDDVHGGDGLALGVLGVGDRVADDVLQEDLEDAAGLLVDEAADALHTTATSQSADGGLRDALDVIAEDLAMALGASLAESLASLAAARHDDRVLECAEERGWCCCSEREIESSGDCCLA